MTASPQPTTHFDGQFSDPAAAATPWPAAEQALTGAELYWLTSVRSDGRPHVTPLVGLWHGGAFVFCTGLQEQKARNLESRAGVAVTTGQNTWSDGLDVVVEGEAVRVTGRERLRELADGYRAKYGDDWDFANDDEAFNPGDSPAAVFEVRPDKVLAFAKSPHAQTAYRFGQA